MCCWVVGFEERVESADCGFDGTVMGRGRGDPVDETYLELVEEPKWSGKLQSVYREISWSSG